MLQGGPAPGIPVMSLAMASVAAHFPGAVYYTLDHRGTGASSRVGCPAEEATDSPGGRLIIDEEWEACLAHVETEWPPPDVFRTTEAALDVAFLVQLLATPQTERRFVYGVSYGTTWTHRIAQVAPDLANGFVLDSVALPTSIFIDRYDEFANRVGLDLLRLCGEDPLCGAKLGDEPEAFARGVIARLANGHCPALGEVGFGATELRATLQWFGMNSFARPLIAAVIYRLDRCSERDAAALLALLAYIVSLEDGEADGGDSPLLRQHVLMSELASSVPRSVAEVAATEETLVFSSGADWTTAEMMGFWPRYAVDAHHGGWAPPDVPLLLMNGTLDLQTTIYGQDVARAALTGPHQSFVEIPWANHGVILASPVATPEAPPCGLQILLKFLEDPLMAPDTGCLADLVPPDLGGPSYLAPFLFHEDDLFENVDPAHACGLPESYLTPSAGAFVAFTYEGPIVDSADFRYGVGDFRARLAPDEAPFDASRFGSFSYLQRYPGLPPTVTVSATAAYAARSATDRRYTSVNVSVTVATLEALRDAGESLLALAEQDGVKVEVTEIHEAFLDGHAYAMVCGVALEDPDAVASSLHLCHTPDAGFGVGEPLQLAGNVALTTDAARLPACYCVVDSSAYTSCDVFDDAEQKATSPPRGPLRAHLPPAPRAPAGPAAWAFRAPLFSVMQMKSAN